MSLDLAMRAAATERVAARFRGRPFSWRARRTCLHLVRSQMLALGHKPPPIPDLRSEKAAMFALKKLGFAGLTDLLDSLLPRIAPAEMLIGDVALVEGGGAFDALMVNAGGKVLGYYDEDLRRGLVVIEPEGSPFKAAWRL